MSWCGAFSAIDWGDAPTWLAAFLAAVAGAVGYKLYRVESDRDKRAEAAQLERDAEQRRAQAVRVAGWYNIKRFEPGNLVGSSWGAQVFNSSDQPVYDVRIFFHKLDKESNLWGPIVGAAKPRLVIPPGDEEFRQLPEDVLDAMEERDASRFSVSFAFRDAGNRWWQREPDGILTELPGPPPIRMPS